MQTNNKNPEEFVYQTVHERLINGEVGILKGLTRIAKSITQICSAFDYYVNANERKN